MELQEARQDERSGRTLLMALQQPAEAAALLQPAEAAALALQQLHVLWTSGHDCRPEVIVPEVRHALGARLSRRGAPCSLRQAATCYEGTSRILTLLVDRWTSARKERGEGTLLVNRWTLNSGLWGWLVT